MSWYVVSFDRRADPSRNYDMIFLGKVVQKYKEAGEPRGFAVFERLLPGEYLHAYYFSPVSVPYCRSLIDDHLGFDRGASCPEDAKFLMGDENIMAEIVERNVKGVPYMMPQNLANQYDELERKKDLLASRPPRATFGEVLELEHQCHIEMHRLYQRGQITRRDSGN